MLTALKPAAVALVLAATMIANPVSASTAEDTVDIDHLIAAYHQAVISHDGARLAALFIPDGSAWVSVLSDEGLNHARVRNPSTSRLRPGSVQAFVAMVGAGKPQLDPRHKDLRIWSDGAIATVTFGFTFFIDGMEQNRGNETWQLVKGDDGWRIVSIVYSSTPPKR